MSDWRKQRDLLIAETMAFAQESAAMLPENLNSPNPFAQPLSRGVGIEPEPRKLPVAAEVPTPKDKLDAEREVIQKRVANFKANQKKFQQEREEYYTRTMSEARATQWTPRSRDKDKQRSR
jgi:hypothetical protein